MSTRVQAHIRGNVVGYVAVFLALNAGAYATTIAHKNSVVSRSIKNGEVKSTDVANDSTAGALKGVDIAGDTLTGADVNEASLDPAVLQKRVSGNCPTGQAIRVVDQAGTVTCEGVGGGGSPTGPATGDLTGSYPAPSIAASAVNSGKVSDNSLTGADLLESSLDSSVLQFRVTGTCPSGQAVGSIAANGSVACGTTNGGTPGGSAGGDLTGTYPNPSITANAVGSSEVSDGSLAAPDLAASSVGSSEVANGSIGSADVAADSLAAADLAPNSAGSSEVGAGAVRASELGSVVVRAAPDVNIGGGASDSVVINCNAGEKAIAGGGIISPGGVIFATVPNESTDGSINLPEPGDAFTGWLVRYNNPTGSFKSASTYAVCLQA